MYQQIELTYSELIRFRKEKNIELFKEGYDDQSAKLICTWGNLNLYCIVDYESNEYTAVSSKLNKPIVFYDRRLSSHDFGDSSTWTSPSDSTCYLEPDAYTKAIIFSILVRLPKNVFLESNNKICYQVYKSLDGVTPVDENSPPVIVLEYNSIEEFLRKSDPPINVSSIVIDNAYSSQMVEIKFDYADSNTLKGAPIVLQKSLNEKIKMWLNNHTPIKDLNGDPLEDKVFVIANCKKTVEF